MCLSSLIPQGELPVLKLIYKIINITNGDFYVGSTIKHKDRFRCHRSRLRKNQHHAKHLQSAWNKYGEHNFIFRVVEVVPEDESLQAVEDRWLSEHVGKDYCYNHSYFSDAPWRGIPKEQQPNFGRVLSAEQKQAISTTLKELYAEAPENHPRYGTTHTEEAKQKMSNNRTGLNAGSSHYLYGKQQPEEVKRKIGDTQRGVPKGPGRKVSPEGMEKIRAAAAAGSYDHWTGRTHTEESKLKMSKAIDAIRPDGGVIHFKSITALRKGIALLAPTINRALKSGKPISKGKYSGWSFKYA